MKKIDLKKLLITETNIDYMRGEITDEQFKIRANNKQKYKKIMEIRFIDNRIMKIEGVGIDDDDINFDLNIEADANNAKLYLKYLIENEITLNAKLPHFIQARDSQKIKSHYLEKQNELLTILRDNKINNLLNKDDDE